MQDRAHTPAPAAAPDLGPPPAVAADPGHAQALLQHLQLAGGLTPDGVAAALRQYPQLRDAVLHEVAARWGTSGVQAVVAAGQRAPSLNAPIAAGPDAIAAAPAHAAPAHQVAERDALNAVITVVARGPDGEVVARWRARGRWVGPLPVRYHGSHAAAAWTWSDPAARETRLRTRADGTGGELVERWAAQHGAATVDVIATAIDAAAPDDEAAEARDEPAGSGPAAADATKHDRDHDPHAGLDAEHQRAVAEFERAIGIDPDDLGAEDDATDHHGAPGGDPQGRTGPDTTIGGTGPGGPKARAGGDHEGSETVGALEGSRRGSALGVEAGSEGGRFGGEGKPGDDGVTMGGGWFGGVIAVPEALKGAVDVLLIADTGDITGAGSGLFAKLSRRGLGKLSAVLVRDVIAREARAAVEHELRTTIERLSRTPKWQALTAEERMRAARIAYYELQRRFFQGFGKAAKDAERTATRTLRGAAGARRAAAQDSLDAARVGAEAAEVEPVAGRLPRNHELAGKEFPREQLPQKYREKGLRFKSTGYPDFEPYAMTLPNGKKTVHIELTGARRLDEALANKAAGLEERPEGFIWHHVEDDGTMMLVPSSLHEAVPHTGGRAHFKHRTGIGYGD